MIKIEKLNENRAFQVVLEVPRGTDYADIVTAATVDSTAIVSEITTEML